MTLKTNINIRLNSAKINMVVNINNFTTKLDIINEETCIYIYIYIYKYIYIYVYLVS